MTRFMIWLCLSFCIVCLCIAIHHAYLGDFYGVVTCLSLSTFHALYGYSLCRDRDGEKKESER